MIRTEIRFVWVIFRFDGRHLTIQRSFENYMQATTELMELSESIEATYWMQQMQVAV